MLVWGLIYGLAFLVAEAVLARLVDPFVSWQSTLASIRRMAPSYALLFVLLAPISLPWERFLPPERRTTGIKRALLFWVLTGAALVVFLGVGINERFVYLSAARRLVWNALVLSLGVIVVVVFMLPPLWRRWAGGAHLAYHAAALSAVNVFFISLMQRVWSALIESKAPLMPVLRANFLRPAALSLALAALVYFLVRLGERAPARRRWAVLAVAGVTAVALGGITATGRLHSEGRGEWGKGPHVIFILIDALRADRLSLYGYPRLTSPHLDELGGEALVFERAFSNANKTIDSVPSFFTSLSPRMLDAMNGVSPAAHTLAEALGEAGYTTAAFSANPYVTRHFGMDQGFASFFGPEEMPSLMLRNALKALGVRFTGLAYRTGLVRGDLYYPDARTMVDRALSYLDSASGERLFLYLHLMDVHGPYLPPREFVGEVPLSYDHFVRYWDLLPNDGRGEGPIPEESHQWLRHLYDAEIRYADEEVGRLLQELKRRGLFDASLIVVTADHGEAFGEHGTFAHPHGNFYHEIMRVPLIVKWPAGLAGGGPRLVTTPVSLADLRPTILAAVRCPPGSGPQLGRDLVPSLRGRESSAPVPLFASSSRAAYRAVLEWPWKMIIMHEGGRGGPESRVLFNLETDAGETSDLYRERADVRERLETALGEHLAWEESHSLPRGVLPLEANIKEQLRSLGYTN